MQRAAEAKTAGAARVHSEAIAFLIMVGALVLAPMFAYPIFLMKALCFALFACAFNLLIGYVGLLSFGHALFFGWASYVSAHAAHRQAVVVSLQTKDPRAADLLQVSADDARLELLSHKASHGEADSRWFSGPLS